MTGRDAGDCYQAAASYLSRLGPVQSEGYTLVHGTVSGQGWLEGRRIDHAWVEVDDGPVVMVIDHSQGKNLVLSRDAYYHIGKISPDECTRYTSEEAVVNMLRSKHFGPWGEEEKSS